MVKSWLAVFLRLTIVVALIGIAVAGPASAGATAKAPGRDSASSFESAAADALEWTQRTPAVAPSPRSSSAMVYDATRQVSVLFGGNGGSDLGDTWEWDGTNWTLPTPAVSPSARYQHAMAYDSVRNVTVLFGGEDDLADTWEYDGVTWTLRSPAGSPSGRVGHTMAYDAARGVTVLFGGAYGDGAYTYLNETWEWDGANWTQCPPTASPAGRAGAAMAYDSDRHVTVLYGGYGYGGFLGDTWEWDGTTWTQGAPLISPLPRHSVRMVYDSARHECILFGGYDYMSALHDDTWAWNGSAWTLQTLTAAPPSREGHAMAYDSARGVTVLHGGWGAGHYDDTWELGSVTYEVFLPLVIR